MIWNKVHLLIFSSLPRTRTVSRVIRHCPASWPSAISPWTGPPLMSITTTTTRMMADLPPDEKPKQEKKKTVSDDEKLPPKLKKMAQLIAAMKVQTVDDDGQVPTKKGLEGDMQRMAGEKRPWKQLRPRASITHDPDEGDRAVPLGDMRTGRQQGFRKVRKRSTTADALFTGEPLGIWTREEMTRPRPPNPLRTWEALEREELDRLLNGRPPRNGFEQMLEWTERGKLWQYPIDNEQGIVDEREVPFFEHVMLDHHLENGFPADGPVRVFMENVCIGLSNNPYMAADRKVAIIDWYRDYFKSKEEILKAIGMDSVTGQSIENQSPDQSI